VAGAGADDETQWGWLPAFVDDVRGTEGIHYRVLAAALRDAIATEEIPVGTKLPAQRRLASLLTVGRTTVVDAYNVLRSESLLRSRQGAGTWVARRPQRTDRPLRRSP
jgi:DNA-binding GntR family transcriptional regulator